MKAKRVWRILNLRFKNLSRLSTMEAPTIPCCHHRTTWYHFISLYCFIIFIPTHCGHCAFQGHCQSFSLGCPRLDGLTAWLDGLRHRSSVSSGRVPHNLLSIQTTCVLRILDIPKVENPRNRGRKAGRDDFQVGELMELGPFQKIIQFPMLVNQKLGKPWAHCRFAFIREMFNPFSEAFHLA